MNASVAIFHASCRQMLIKSSRNLLSTWTRALYYFRVLICSYYCSESGYAKIKVQMYRQRMYRAFTIVELLVVVVVISIIASVMVVPFNNVRQAANNSARISAAEKMVKLIHAYVAINGGSSFKSLLPAPPTYSACLGSGYADADPGAGVGCYDSANLTYTRSQASIDTALQTVGSISVGYPMFKYVVSPDTWIQTAPVLWFDKSLPTNIIYIDYTLQGDGKNCGNGATAGVNSEWGPSTYCRITMDLGS